MFVRSETGVYTNRIVLCGIGMNRKSKPIVFRDIKMAVEDQIPVVEET